MKICIGTPSTSNRSIRHKTALSLFQLINNTPHEFHFIVATQGYTICENRTYIVTEALRANCTHLLFVDDDMMFGADSLERLLSHQKEIAGVNYYSRILPLKSTVSHEYDAIPAELFEAISVGTGLLLVDLSVFLKIKRPWFFYPTSEMGQTTMSEDQWFCDQAYKAGYKIWCDPTIPVGHVGDYIYADEQSLKQLTW